MKKCANPNCGWKKLDQFYSDRTRHDRKCQYCKTCFDVRRKEREQKNPEISRARSRASYLRYKKETMSHYGGVCQCCGESRLEFLTIDHINQDGAEHRRKMGFDHTCTGLSFYLWLRKNGWPNLGLQVLCANCNSARGSCNTCPHVREREYALIDGLGI